MATTKKTIPSTPNLPLASEVSDLVPSDIQNLLIEFESRSYPNDLSQDWRKTGTDDTVAGLLRVVDAKSLSRHFAQFIIRIRTKSVG